MCSGELISLRRPSIGGKQSRDKIAVDVIDSFLGHLVRRNMNTSINVYLFLVSLSQVEEAVGLCLRRYYALAKIGMFYRGTLQILLFHSCFALLYVVGAPLHLLHKKFMFWWDYFKVCLKASMNSYIHCHASNGSI